MNADQGRSLETEVVKLGLAGLAGLKDNVGEFVQVIAKVVNTWKSTPNRQGEWIDRHKFLRDLFAECDQAERSDMYSAIVPHLNFKALPLPTYETMMTERMENLVSKGAAKAEGKAPHPTKVGGRLYAEVSEAQATQALVKIHCWTCTRKKNFLADTPAGAMIAARKAGWQRIPTADGPKEHCSFCIIKLVRRSNAKVS